MPVRIAHLITTYKCPVQLERLVDALAHKDAACFIHVDGNVSLSEYLFLEKKDGVRLIKNRKRVVWGGYSFTEAILNSIEEIANSESKFDYINLLSSQDYPIKPIEEFVQFLTVHKGYSFIAYEGEDSSKWWKESTSRIYAYNLNDFKFRGKYFIQQVLNTFLPLRKFPMLGKLYGSSCATWWTMDMACASYVLSFINSNKKLTRYMKFTWGADEFLLPSIVMNSPFAKLTLNNNLRYIDWSEGGSNPKILGMKDLPSIKRSDNFFARKFDILIDEKVLTAIDTEMLNYV
ncbi:Core-2/I-Branching enzyme [Cnuella takakiae]|uniref:Peptide O-xylosyltransferase n=1 Tax=Cnuella takakiae TaxID=1302690 RepID=A0A1M5CK89_9BACT|nr:beta-1,6-N-acetylglucosaminyltransferase [Cnuella takakiae]OLY91854.1 hypothetical protein BUE76_08035 [Cnuella takakiae]SHF55017.1 Core-2/I-Branching enzyme [Cnuella takakiae]